MENYKRYSPVNFSGGLPETMVKDRWEIAFDHENWSEGTLLIDLSPINKWDLQGENLSLMQPCGIPMPKTPGQCVFENGFLINLLKWNWATIWCVGGKSDQSFQEYAYTDVTEAYALLCLTGKDVFAVMEKVATLDLLSPERKSPFIMMGPVVNVRSQVAVLEMGAGHKPIVLIACARGYGQCLADAILEAGSEWGVQPVGDKNF